MSNLGEEGKKFELEDRLIAFAVEIIRLAEEVPRTRSGLHITGQLIKCGTSPAANYGEAQSAESSTDFVHKMKVCLKELRETRIWLKMIVKAKLLDSSRPQVLIQESNELISIFVSSIRTALKRKRRA
ncbi:MAG: four helix bundle protein [Deltaproteobacteria bacterium HGW-Deltaproteobacteria-21]|nr:MAG: four helix bundle protein [Deltaproteobacteria bacterium HGW-Deltaproteobacteria-21]